MTWSEVFEQLNLMVADRRTLLAYGATGAGLTSAVRGGYLVRPRRDHYVLQGTPIPVVQAVRVGGRLGCVSALHLLGAFAMDSGTPHIHLLRSASRLRSPHSRWINLADSERDDSVLHWWPLLDSTDVSEHAVGVREAVAQVVRCQEPWHAIATLDSVLHQGLLSLDELSALFRQVPERCVMLLGQLDGRAEAGQESILRLLMRQLGLHCEIQVEVTGVGRVDMIVEGILILEADSRLAHDGWEMHVRDRNRDIDSARQGYMSLRPAYQRTMFDPTAVQEAVLALLAAWNHHRVHLL
ncbi:hypothetical protein [Frigoribacterium sp. UYMn621]|uniref:hypothetical protein n=1 Tax=Frigoribacterium sp. UYMn621 TaxID=3156343 RepID=UPI003394091D